MSNQVLIILHQATSTPGRIGTLLKSRGYNLIIKRPALGDKLPDTLEGDYAAIMFGGPMSANDKDDFIRYEKDWINSTKRRYPISWYLSWSAIVGLQYWGVCKDKRSC